jgi:hypothetical protein
VADANNGWNRAGNTCSWVLRPKGTCRIEKTDPEPGLGRISVSVDGNRQKTAFSSTETAKNQCPWQPGSGPGHVNFGRANNGWNRAGNTCSWVLRPKGTSRNEKTDPEPGLGRISVSVDGNRQKTAFSPTETAKNQCPWQPGSGPGHVNFGRCKQRVESGREHVFVGAQTQGNVQDREN